jgi:hypothetical protein
MQANLNVTSEFWNSQVALGVRGYIQNLRVLLNMGDLAIVTIETIFELWHSHVLFSSLPKCAHVSW